MSEKVQRGGGSTITGMRSNASVAISNKTEREAKSKESLKTVQGKLERRLPEENPGS